jgi:hopanoid biosynthesis associated radical SAM protein HpnH
MRFPLQLHLSMARYLISRKLRRVSRFPLVLMLEPTHQCNLSCAGCGRIREYRATLDKMMSLQECLEAVDEAGAPVVTITGGEPFLYPHLDRLVQEILKRRKNIYLCTNATLLENKLHLLSPHPRLTLNVHLDGFGEAHDLILGRKGLFDIAVESIRLAKEKGFRVSTNTTIYKTTDPFNLERLFDLLDSIGVDGILVSPAFHYGEVSEDIFLNKAEIINKFNELSPLFKKHRLISTPMYLDFLLGKRQLLCTPWGNPTRNVAGWKSPCYLITDTHYATFEELMSRTPWDAFESGRDPRCRNCMVHCGFEPSVVRVLGKSVWDFARMIRWNFSD